MDINNKESRYNKIDSLEKLIIDNLIDNQIDITTTNDDERQYTYAGVTYDTFQAAFDAQNTVIDSLEKQFNDRYPKNNQNQLRLNLNYIKFQLDTVYMLVKHQQDTKKWSKILKDNVMRLNDLTRSYELNLKVILLINEEINRIDDLKTRYMKDYDSSMNYLKDVGVTFNEFNNASYDESTAKRTFTFYLKKLFGLKPKLKQCDQFKIDHKLHINEFNDYTFTLKTILKVCNFENIGK